jgi:hypothetical protein
MARLDWMNHDGTTLITQGNTWVGDFGIGGEFLNANGTVIITKNGTIVSEKLSGQKVHLAFGQLNIVTNLAATVITPMGGSATLSEFIMDRGGSIIGVVAYLNASITAGTITVSPTLDGTTKMTATINATHNATVSTQNRGTDTFTAKQRIGLKLTSTTNIAPETCDLMAAIIVEI